jgi:hypothetical protein
MLNELFEFHVIESVSKDLYLSGKLDTELLPRLQEAGFDALLTADVSMLTEHREALRASGLHWIGINQVKVPGEAGIAFLAASAFAALPLIFDEILGLPPGERRAFKVKRLGVQRGQRYTAQPI